MIVITGTQRSGTSLMAKFAQQCGYDLGTEFWDDRLDGGLENPVICEHFSDLLESEQFPFKGYWDMVGEYKRSLLSTLDLEVAKFSYLLMNPDFVDQWYKERGASDKFIIMWRDAEDIHKSKTMRDNIFGAEDHPMLNQSAEKINWNRHRSLRKMEEYGMQYHLVDFPNIKDWQLTKIARFSNLKLTKNVWDKLYNVNKIHFK